MKPTWRILPLAALIVLLAFAGFALAPPFPRPLPRPLPRPRVRPHLPAPRPPVRVHITQPRHIPPPPPPRSVTLPREVRATIPSNPARAIVILRRERAVLSPAEQAILARAAVIALALRVHRTTTPATALVMVREARGHGQNRLDERAEQILEAIEARLTDRVLEEGLTAIVQLGADKHWAQAGERALLQIQRGQLPAATRQNLDDLARVCRRITALDLLAGALEASAKSRRQESATLLADPRLAQLPAGLRPRVASLRSLSELLQACPATRWQKAPDAARLHQLVADVRAAARADFRGTSSDTALAGLVLQDLAVKAFIDGFPETALALYPESASPQNAALLLSDLKTLAEGQGEVSTWPAQGALLAEGGPPPALQALVADQGNTWRSRLRAAAPAGPAPMEKVASLEKPMRDRLVVAAGDQRRTAVQDANLALQSVRQRHHELIERNQQEDKLLAEVEKRLERKLVPAERVLARQLARKGQKAEEIHAAVAQLKLAAK